MAKQGELADVPYANVFNGVTIYTSLESCAQCSGIMALGYVLRVVYLQSDPGQNLIGNILYNLTRPQPREAVLYNAARAGPRLKPKDKYWAPEPLSADLFGFIYKQQLEDAFQSFMEKGKQEPDKWYFYEGNGKRKKTDSLTSFLCTDLAKAIFDSAAEEFRTMQPRFPTWAPIRGDGEKATMDNGQALEHAKAFLAHAITSARRGTPHR